MEEARIYCLRYKYSLYTCEGSARGNILDSVVISELCSGQQGVLQSRQKLTSECACFFNRIFTLQNYMNYSESSCKVQCVRQWHIEGQTGTFERQWAVESSVFPFLKGMSTRGEDVSSEQSCKRFFSSVGKWRLLHQVFLFWHDAVKGTFPLTFVNQGPILN